MLCVTNGRLQLLVGYTTPVIKMLIKHQNIKIISEFNIGIIRRGHKKRCTTQISVTCLWITFTYNGANGGLRFMFWIFKFYTIFQKKKWYWNFDVFKFIIHLKIRNIVTFGRLQIVWQASMKVYSGCFVLRKPFNFKTV